MSTIKLTTIVEGWPDPETKNSPGKAVFEGHIDLDLAIRGAANVGAVLVGPADVTPNAANAYVRAYHHVELIDGAEYSGNWNP